MQRAFGAGVISREGLGELRPLVKALVYFGVGLLLVFVLILLFKVYGPCFQCFVLFRYDIGYITSQLE